MISEVYSVFDPKWILSEYKKWLVLVHISINIIIFQLRMKIINRELGFNANITESDRVVDVQALFFVQKTIVGDLYQLFWILKLLTDYFPSRNITNTFDLDTK